MIEPVEVQVTYSDGRTVRMRRCGALPDLFVSRDGEFYQISDCPMSDHNGNAIIRYHKKSMSARYLVADAWRPGWDREFRTVFLKDDTYPMDVSVDNLVFNTENKRGRPRSSTLQEQVQLARIAVQVNDINIAADEVMSTPQEVLEAVLQWFPKALVEMQGLPENWLESRIGRDRLQQAKALDRRRKLRAAEKRAQRANLVPEEMKETKVIEDDS